MEAAKDIETTKDQDPDKGTLLVMDTNCRPPWSTREHSITLENGGEKAYEFHEAEYTRMPHSHAMKFLIDDAFVVCDKPIEDGGKRWAVLPKGKKSDGRFDLQHDELIARFEELTRDALLIRAQAKVGGEDFNNGTQKAKLIAFLMDLKYHAEKNTKEAEEAVVDGPADQIDTTDEAQMSGAEVDAMFAD